MLFKLMALHSPSDSQWRVTVATCGPIWDPHDARLAVDCFPLVSAAPSAVAAFVLLSLLLRPLLGKPFRWARSFASEEYQALPDGETPPGKTWNHWTALLFILSVIGLSLQIAVSFFPPWFPLGFLSTVPWVVSVLIVLIDRPRSASKSLILVFGVTFLFRLVILLSIVPYARSGNTLPILECSVAFCTLISLLWMPIRDPQLGTHDIANASQPPTYHLRSPEDNITVWQFMTVSWMSPLISIGASRQLNDEDVWKLPYEFQHNRLHILFRDLKGSVIKRLLAANGLDLVITTVLSIFELVANVSSPLLLQQLLRSFQDQTAGKHASLIYATLILVLRLAASQSSIFSLWYSRRCYERSRGEMITMLYEKTLSRKAFSVEEEQKVENNTEEVVQNSNGSETTSQPPEKSWAMRLNYILQLMGLKKGKLSSSDQEPKKKPASMGKILNLMRNDVYEVAQRFWEFPTIITKPLGFLFSIVLMWKLLGWSSLLGLSIILLAQFLNTLIIKALLSWETVRRTATDVLLEVTSQFVESIRHLRWYDWQNQWLEQIMTARQRELHFIVITSLWHSALNFVNIASSGLLPAAAFYAYTMIAGKSLTVDVAFPALQIFTMVEKSFKELPGLVTVLLNARIAMGRIEDFMAEPDKAEDEAEDITENIQPSFQNAAFSWPGSQKNILENVNVHFPQGLTIICGKVGEGKTALLQAILGELDQRGGKSIRPSEMVGYCSQTPWLQSMSIRDNILFTSPLDERRYKQVLDVCALTPDLANFKHGDLSNLGENGIGLSGGQRARVALARAIYSQSRILLLDDPLAALDHDTAETIVRKFLCGPLAKDRTIILVTHRVDLCLHLADQIVEIADRTVRLLDPEDFKKNTNAAHQFLDHHEAAEEAANEEEELPDLPDAFIEEEKRPHGSVMMSVYWRYIKAGGIVWWLNFVLLFVLMRLLRVGNSWFLKEWGERYQEAGTNSLSDIFDHLPPPQKRVTPWLTIFTLIAIAQACLYLCLDFTALFIIFGSGRRLFKEVMDRVCGATFRFYDVTPVGRLMNRLTSDIGALDGDLTHQLLEAIFLIVGWISSILVFASVTPLFVVFSCALSALFVLIFLRFLPSSQSLRRLEMVSLTPLMSNFGALLAGLTTVRAFRAQSQFQNRVITVVDAFQKMDHFYWSLQAWLQYRFDAVSAFSTFALTLLALWDGLSPGLTAFVLTAASNFVTVTHDLCKQYGQLQMDFVSVERVIELLDLDQEPVAESEPPASWPKYGDDIVFDNVTIKYAPHLDPALSEVSLHIPGGSTTAILGRTGSGKSTLALTLLATILPEAGGQISIGGLDISKVNVHALRQRVTFVAQDPVLFNGSIRKNLDPLEEHTDEECASVLHRVLGEEWELEKELEGGGRNLSQGQRQLVGLGRAILRRSPIVVLDEATASIDMETANYIQQVLREELKECTIVTIAHRLEAVKDANYCIILDQGKVARAGPASEVMQSK